MFLLQISQPITLNSFHLEPYTKEIYFLGGDMNNVIEDSVSIERAASESETLK